MKKLMLFVIIILNICFNIYGQTTERCKTSDVEEPPYNPLEVTPDGYIQIPVVFHIIMKNDGSYNVSDEQIQQQMQKINSVYSGDEIVFVLFKVNRIYNESWATQAAQNDSILDEMMESSAFQTERYMNVYSISTGVDGWLGLSSFPWEYPEGDWHDGIVLDYGTFPGGNQTNYNLGATLVHESGHYLGLYHTFTGKCSESNDYVDDTPAHNPESEPISIRWNCDENKNTCPSQPGNDPVHNHMNYTDDYCANELTVGQFARIREKVGLYRPVYSSEYIFVLDQNFSNNQRIAGSSIYRYQGNSFTTLPVSTEPASFFTSSEITDEIFKADVSVFSNEKFKTWLPFNEIKIVAGGTFDVEIYNMNSRFHPKVNNVSIRNYADGNESGGEIGFKDPWYIYYPDPDFYYELNNRGLDATPLNKNSPLNFTLSQYSDYKGVFLNQEIAPNKPYYSVQAISPQEVPINNRTHNFYFQNWTGTNANFEDANSLTTGVVFTNDNAVVNANMKGTQLSNQTDAFDNSSQRKFIKTNDGVMHHVYESMGKVWYEKSTNNGTDWILMNDGKPLSGNNLSKNPSVSSLLNNKIAVLFQQEDAGQCWVIAKIFIPGQSLSVGESYIKEIFFNYSMNDVQPVGVLTNYYDNFVVVWNQNTLGIFGETPGMYYNYSIFNNSTNNFDGWHFTSQDEGRVTESDEWSYAPSIACYINGNPATLFHLIWEQKSEVEYSTIRHITGIGANYGNGDEVFFNEDLQSLSTQSGFQLNSQPTLIVWNDNIARVGWLGKRLEPNGTWTKKTVFAASDNPSHYWNFGNSVTSSNINRTNNASGSGIGYIIGWSENNTTNKIVDNYLSSSHIRTISSTGRDIQISNGSTFENMFATSFNTSNSTDMYFNQSNNIQSYYDLPSKVSTTSISEGREGIVSKNKLQFYFGMGDIKVDDELISFKDIEESVRFSNVSTLNNYLTSKPFQLSDNSSFYYSVQFGITDTSFAQNTLTANSFVTFRVLLVDDNTNQLLGAYDEVTYTLENLLQHKNIGYQVNTTGIGNRTVRLVLEVTDNIEPKYALAEKYADDNVITKEKYETIEYKGKLGITEYALAQNYPNPFNPITTINYQIPKSGRVVLKVYDILGKEIATLVNEEKEIGRYSVNFDASKLSSGVYLYELVANDYRAVKKLMVIK